MLPPPAEESNMRSLRHRSSVAIVSFCLAGLAGVASLEAQQQARGTVRCESDGTYRRCPAGATWRGARLVQQLSTKACVQGRTWGLDGNVLWVNDGCRGVFEAGDPYARVGERVTCSSVRAARTECPADTRFGARMVRQLSTVGCVQGRTWGTDDAALWVDRGCRAEFEIGDGSAGVPAGGGTERLVCGNLAGRQVTCPTNGYATESRLVRDLSGGRCREGQNWGFTDAFIWANAGCRAEFEVAYRSATGGGPAGGTGTGEALAQRVTCGAATGQRVTCSTGGTIAGARLLRDMSGARCRHNLTWGYDQEVLWIDDGCIGEFELMVRADQSGGTAVTDTAVASREIVCGSDGGVQVTCRTQGHAAAVRLVADLSGGRCRERQTWGFTDSYLWTKEGCRARFSVTYRSPGRSRD
jgi:hypothetical protein